MGRGVVCARQGARGQEYRRCAWACGVWRGGRPEAGVQGKKKRRSWWAITCGEAAKPVDLFPPTVLSQGSRLYVIPPHPPVPIPPIRFSAMPECIRSLPVPIRAPRPHEKPERLDAPSPPALNAPSPPAFRCVNKRSTCPPRLGRFQASRTPSSLPDDNTLPRHDGTPPKRLHLPRTPLITKIGRPSPSCRGLVASMLNSPELHAAPFRAMAPPCPQTPQ
jgi:hypothetical protein